MHMVRDFPIRMPAALWSSANGLGAAKGTRAAYSCGTLFLLERVVPGLQVPIGWAVAAAAIYD